jgi:large repetitive protein
LSGNPTATGTFPITFYATNTAGTTPQSFTLTIIGPPGAPTIGSATAGNGDATVSFTAPASNGGSSILGYTVTATDTIHAFNGGQTQTGGPSSTSITVGGLTNGDTYTFTVTATNGVGTGPTSAASNSVTPTILIPVAITSADATAVAAGGKVAFTVTATGNPAPTIANPGGGLPSWLTFKGGRVGKDATLKGKAPTISGGVYQFTLEAANGVAPPVYQTFTVDVLQVTSASTASGTVGQSFTFDVTTSNAPANPTLAVTGLPPGLTFTPAATGGTGTITGTPTHAKSYKVKVTATSGSVVAKQTLVITVAG